MALASRRRRRRRPRWLVVALVATIGVLLFNVTFSSSDGPSLRLAQLAYIDQVRPQIERSTDQGASLAQVRNDAVRLGRQGIARSMARTTRESRAVLAAVQAAKPPPPQATAHSILVAMAAIRVRVASSVAEGLAAAMTDGPAEPSVESLARAGEEMVASDRIYQVFLESLPRPDGVGGPVLPKSAWASDPHLWARPELRALVASLRSSTTTSAVHDVGVLTVVTNPVAVGTEGNASVLPLVGTLRVEVVVANTGNTGERAVPVVATLVGPAGETDTARDFVDLSPGQRRSVPLGGLRPVPGGPSTLKVVVGPVDGESSIPDNELSLALVLRG